MKASATAYDDKGWATISDVQTKLFEEVIRIGQESELRVIEMTQTLTNVLLAGTICKAVSGNPATKVNKLEIVGLGGELNYGKESPIGIQVNATGDNLAVTPQQLGPVDVTLFFDGEEVASGKTDATGRVVLKFIPVDVFTTTQYGKSLAKLKVVATKDTFEAAQLEQDVPIERKLLLTPVFWVEPDVVNVGDVVRPYPTNRVVISAQAKWTSAS